MNCDVANKVIEFIFTATGRNAIVCDVDGVIVAAKVASRVGNVHPGAKRMLAEGLPSMVVTVADEEASGGAVRAGCNMPFYYNGELMGSIGVPGDPETTEPVTRMASGLISKELREQDLLEGLVGHARQMDQAIAAIVATVSGVNALQSRVSGLADQVDTLVQASFDDLKSTDEVIGTIQGIASNTQMLGLNAAIEAAHAREHGRGFSIVAEAVRKLSQQCSASADSIQATQAHLHGSMSQVVACSRDLAVDTHEQGRATTAITAMVSDLKQVSEALMAMTR